MNEAITKITTVLALGLFITLSSGLLIEGVSLAYWHSTHLTLKHTVPHYVLNYSSL